MEINWVALEVGVAFLSLLATIYALRRSDQNRTESRVREIEKNLSDFKTEAAQRFATQGAIQEIESRVLAAINRLGDRLDRFVETMMAGRHRDP